MKCPQKHVNGIQGKSHVMKLQTEKRKKKLKLFDFGSFLEKNADAIRGKIYP